MGRHLHWSIILASEDWHPRADAAAAFSSVDLAMLADGRGGSRIMATVCRLRKATDGTI